MKKKYIILGALIFLVILLGLSYIYFSKSQTITSGIKSIMIAGEKHELSKGVYEYEIGVNFAIRNDEISYDLVDDTARIEIKPNYDTYLIGETIEIIHTINEENLTYKVKFINKIDSSLLNKLSNDCEIDKSICEIIKDDTNFKIELKNENLIFKVNDKGNLILNPKNYEINSITFINNGVAFIYYNLVDNDDRTLYFLNNVGSVVFSSRILDEKNNAAVTGIIEIENDKFLINGTKIVRGFDYQNNDFTVSMCEAPKNTLVEFRYEIIYDGLNEPVFNKIKDINAKEYLEIKGDKEGFEPCSNIEYP